MSLKAISEKLTTQNKLFVEFTDETYQKNSDRVQESFDGLNESVSSIASFLMKEDDEDRTEESRRKLASKDDADADSKNGLKGLCSGMLGSKEQKSGKGLLGSIFSKALGFLVKSLPLIGLAAMFFGDVITGLLTAAFGDYDKASILKNMLVGGLLGAIFGFRGAILGAIAGYLFSEETWVALKEDFGSFLESWRTGDWKGVGQSLLDLAAGIGKLAAALGLAFAVIAPLKSAKLLKGLVTGNKGVGTAAAAAAATAAATAAKTTSTAAAPASKSAQRLLNTEATRNLTNKQKLDLNAQNLKISKDGVIVDSKNRMISAEKQTAALKSVGVDTTKSAGAQVAKTAGKKAALGAAAKAIPGLGILAGIGFGINSLRNGDPVAAGLHVASGIAGIIPGIGTAASLGLTGAAVARDMGYLGGGESDVKVEVNGKSESLNEATRERDELVAKTSSNVIMDNSTTNNVSNGGGGGVSISSPISFFDELDPYNNARV